MASSGICVIVRLDPFYQKFLRGYFGVKNEQLVFAFPCRSRYKFNELLHWLVDYPPLNNKPKDYGESSFRIELPRSQYFSVECRNHFSKKSEDIFRQQVRKFYLNILYSCIDDLVFKYKLSQIDAIDRFMEMYDLCDFDNDRLKKTIQRYRKRIAVDFYNKNAAERKRKSRNKNLQLSA